LLCGNSDIVGPWIAVYSWTILVIGHLTYTDTGWHTTGDALLANTAAAIARERLAIAREEATSQYAVAIAPVLGAVAA
jgi:hypothetical protein